MESPMVYVLLFAALAGVIAIIVWMGFLTKDKDNAGDIQKNLGIVAGVTAVLIGIFGTTAYMYFAANTNYLTPFLLVISFVNLFLSLFATSAATLQLAYS